MSAGVLSTPDVLTIRDALLFFGLPVDLDTVLPLTCGHQIDLGPALEHGTRLARFLSANMLAKRNRVIWCGFCGDFVLPVPFPTTVEAS